MGKECLLQYSWQTCLVCSGSYTFKLKLQITNLDILCVKPLIGTTGMWTKNFFGTLCGLGFRNAKNTVFEEKHNWKVQLHFTQANLPLPAGRIGGHEGGLPTPRFPGVFGRVLPGQPTWCQTLRGGDQWKCNESKRPGLPQLHQGFHTNRAEGL